MCNLQEISTKKTKTMAFSGKFPVRTKIVAENEVLEQVGHCNYMWCNISYGYSQSKITKDTSIKFYEIMVVPTLTYASEMWVIMIQKEEYKYKNRKFTRQGYSKMDMIKNQEIRELQIQKLNERRLKGSEHIDRMSQDGLSKKAKHCKATNKKFGQTEETVGP